jgi:Lipocalin-like domain
MGRKSGTGDVERAALHKTMVAVSGKVRVEGMDFIISVDVSWNEYGTEQRRHFRIEGDKLFVETAPGPNPVIPGKSSFGRLVFEQDNKGPEGVSDCTQTISSVVRISISQVWAIPACGRAGL